MQTVYIWILDPKIKEFLQINNKKITQSKKMDTGSEHFSKDKNRMANKHTRRYSTSPAIREICQKPQ